MGTLLLVHAHPDDEAIATGGVMMKAKEDGHRVVLVTATKGEAGEIHTLDPEATRPRLAEVRTEELRRAGEILGVDRQEFLGYRDSGMVGTGDNENPASFHLAPLAEAAEKLAAIMREEHPDVVVTYGADGTYGHPDHIKAHQVTNAAFDILEREGRAPKKLYYNAIPREQMQAFQERMSEEAVKRGEEPRNFTIPGTPFAEITAHIDVKKNVTRKRDAFAAHVTQNDPKGPFTTMASEIYELAFGTEYFVLARGKPGSSLPETDLFAGV